jgi:hypothetical protein
MSTRAYVGYLTKSGSFKYIYSHNDNYPSGTGQILLDHYDLKKTRKLIKLGSASVIEKNLDPMGNSGHNFENRQAGVCVFYHRDRGEKKVDTKASTMKTFDLGMLLDGVDYVYLIDQQGHWFISDGDKMVFLTDARTKKIVKI